MKKVLVERDNGEIKDVTDLPPEEVEEFMSFMQQILFAYAMLKIIKDGKN